MKGWGCGHGHGDKPEKKLEKDQDMNGHWLVVGKKEKRKKKTRPSSRTHSTLSSSHLICHTPALVSFSLAPPTKATSKRRQHDLGLRKERPAGRRRRRAGRPTQFTHHLRRPQHLTTVPLAKPFFFFFCKSLLLWVRGGCVFVFFFWFAGTGALGH